MTAAVAGRLAAVQIQLVSEAKSYCLFTRGNVLAIANRTLSGEFSSVGSSGILTPEGGMSYLIWRDGRALLASHGGAEILAAEEQVEEIRRFSADLKIALGLDTEAR